MSQLLTLLPSIAALILTSEVAIANPNINRNQVENTRPFNFRLSKPILDKQEREKLRTKD
jgi:hypothetical protein